MMIKRLLRSPFHVLRNFTSKSIVDLKLKKLCAVDIGTNMESAVELVIKRAIDFLELRREPTGALFEFRYSSVSSVPTIYGSAYACMIWSLTGELFRLDNKRRSEWLAYFDSYQNPKDGLFYDPTIRNEIYDDTDWWGARHLALHLITTYTVLGGKPKHPFRFLEAYYDIDFLAGWLDGFDWLSSIGRDNDIDNKIMNIGCLLQYQRDAWGDPKASAAISFLKDYLKKKINPQTGMWGYWDINDPVARSRMVQFAYHLFPLYFYDKEEIEGPDKIVEAVLKTQNKFGGFGVKGNSSACEDIDSIDILCRLADRAPGRRQVVDHALRKAQLWVIRNQVKDGGFVFRLHEPFTYGHPEMSSLRNEGSMFSTWFRLLSLAYLARHFKEKNFFIQRAPGLEN